MVDFDPIPIPTAPLEVGRDNYVDGVLGSGEYLSEVRVINLTPHEVSEIKTSVITLPEGEFPFVEPGAATPISVFANDVTAGYVQWEPMGDLYPPSIGAPLGSHKYLRVKWDCYMPPGSPTADYTKQGPQQGNIEGPYDYYAEKIYTFRSVEPRDTISFTLTDTVASALGLNGCTIPTTFEFSAHGFVNSFNFVSGMYGQDKQQAFPNARESLPARRDPIYKNNGTLLPGGEFESPLVQGQECLAKEYMVHGRIVPELDYNGALFQVIQEGDPRPGFETSSIYATSGRDAPPFWYNFHYELQHQKNIIPFTFMWGVGLTTYDGGTYSPVGTEIDLPDEFGLVTGEVKYSNNNGQRRRSTPGTSTWTGYFGRDNTGEKYCPNTFHSQDDITFSIIGPDTVCHTSSVTVCSVYNETTVNNLKKTVINWFDKRNQNWYDVEVFGYNFLPTSCTWVLRGCLHFNENYIPTANLSTLDRNSQRSNALEKTWAVDLNFNNRKLFTLHKNAGEEPPQEWLTRRNFTNKQQTAAYWADSLWKENDYTVQIGYAPHEVSDQEGQVNPEENPYYLAPKFATETVGLIKNLREPWAMNPIGLQARPGVAAEQPGFSFVGAAGVLAAAGLPDARAIEACLDLEWNNRLSVDVGRDGRIINQFDEAWTAKRFMDKGLTLSVPVYNDTVRQVTGDQNYTDWLAKTVDSPEFARGFALIKESSILGYNGTSQAFGGNEATNGFGRGYKESSYGGNGRNKAYGQPQYNGIGKLRGGRKIEHFMVLDRTTGVDSNIRKFDPQNLEQGIIGLAYNSVNNLYYAYSNEVRRVLEINATTGESVYVGNTLATSTFTKVIGFCYNKVDGLFYGLGVKKLNGNIRYQFQLFTFDLATGAYTLGAIIYDYSLPSNEQGTGDFAKALDSFRGINFNSATNKIYAIKFFQLDSQGKDVNCKLVELNTTTGSFTEVMAFGHDEFSQFTFDGNTNNIYAVTRDASTFSDQYAYLTLYTFQGTYTYIGNAYYTAETNAETVGIGINEATGALNAIHLRNADWYDAGANNRIGYPIPKHQYAIGYFSPGLWHSGTTREGYTFSHSAWSQLTAFALMSGDKIALNYVDYSMRIIMNTHNDAEHVRSLFKSRDFALGGLVWGNAGRTEGRPLQGLINGIGITRDRKLRERAITMLSRRFWNIYNTQDFELTPTGVPNKPWVSLWYPMWGAGFSGVYDYSTKRPSFVPTDGNRQIRDYFYLYSQARNFKQSLYNTQGFRLSEIVPNRDIERTAVWHYNDSGNQGANKGIYVHPFEEFTYVEKPFAWSNSRNRIDYIKYRMAEYSAPGLKLPGPPGEGTPTPATIQYLAFRFMEKDNPLRYYVYAPPSDDPTLTVSSIPEVTGVPTSQLSKLKSFQYITQGYQQSLIYPYIYPMNEVFQTYSLIFAERASLNKQVDFVAYFNSYDLLSQELADTYVTQKNYFVDVAKTIANNVLLKSSLNSAIFAGEQMYSYLYAMSSPSRPYEWYTPEEKTIGLNSNAAASSFPVICEDVTNTDVAVMSSYILGAYAVAYAKANGARFSGAAGGNAFSTVAWTFNSILWAWDVLNKHSDPSDLYAIEALDDLKRAIESFVGPEKFSIDNYNRGADLRDNFYGRIWGNLGWPSPGVSPPVMQQLGAGDPEVLPWFIGCAEDIWRDRSPGANNIRLIRGELRLSTEVDATFEVISGRTRTYTYAEPEEALYNPGKGYYPFTTQGLASKQALPTSVERIDNFGMEKFYALNGLTNVFDFSQFESKLNEISGVGRQASIRIWIDQPFQVGASWAPLAQGYKLPRFLRLENGGTVESFRYYVDQTNPGQGGYDVSGYIPDYNNPDLVAEIVRLVTELGRVYDGDPRIAEMQVGFLGHWGEWNQYQAYTRSNVEPISNRPYTPYPPIEVINEVTQAFDDAFNITPVVGRFLDSKARGVPLPDSPTQMTEPYSNVGIHDDSFGYMTLGTAQFYTQPQVNHYQYSNKLIELLQSGEVRPEIERISEGGTTYLLDFLNDSYQAPPLIRHGAQNLFETLRFLRSSMLSAATMFGVIANDYAIYDRTDPNNPIFIRNGTYRDLEPEKLRNLIRSIHLMGYSLFVESSILQNDLVVGNSLELSVTITNRGVARFFQNWPVVLTLTNGQQTEEVVTDWSLSSIDPDQTVTFSKTIPGAVIARSFLNSPNLSVRMSIRKPAAFINDVIFMNDEVIQNTAFMDLGQVSLTSNSSDVFITGELLGSTELEGQPVRFKQHTIFPKDYGNEFATAKTGARIIRVQILDSLLVEQSTNLVGTIETQSHVDFDNLEIIGQSIPNLSELIVEGITEFRDLLVIGSTTLVGNLIADNSPPGQTYVYINGAPLGQTIVNVDKLVLDLHVEGIIEMLGSYDGSLFIQAQLPNADFLGQLELEGFLSLDIGIANLDVEGQSILDLVDDFDLYRRLSDAEFLGEMSVLGSLNKTVYIDGSIELASDLVGGLFVKPSIVISGELPLSSDLQGQLALSRTLSGEIIGQTLLSGQPRSNLIILSDNLLISGATNPQARLFIYPGAGRGAAEFTGPDVTVIEDGSIPKQSFARQLDTTTATFEGIPRQRQSFEQKLMSELLERSTNDAKVTELYRETLEYLINVFSQYVYINDENKVVKVPCWHGSVERVVAKLRQEHNIVLPVMSVFRTGNNSDEKRRRFSGMIVYDKYWDLESQRAVRVARLAPTPVTISYKLNVWTKYQEDMDHLTEQVHRDFNPDINIKTSYNTSTKGFLSSESPSNELTVSEGQDRVIRKAFDFTVESYIPSPRFVITNTGKIEEFNAEVLIPIK